MFSLGLRNENAYHKYVIGENLVLYISNLWCNVLWNLSGWNDVQRLWTSSSKASDHLINLWLARYRGLCSCASVLLVLFLFLCFKIQLSFHFSDVFVYLPFSRDFVPRMSWCFECFLKYSWLFLLKVESCLLSDMCSTLIWYCVTESFHCCSGKEKLYSRDSYHLNLRVLFEFDLAIEHTFCNAFDRVTRVLCKLLL